MAALVIEYILPSAFQIGLVITTTVVGYLVRGAIHKYSDKIEEMTGIPIIEKGVDVDGEKESEKDGQHD